MKSRVRKNGKGKKNNGLYTIKKIEKKSGDRMKRGGPSEWVWGLSVCVGSGERKAVGHTKKSKRERRVVGAEAVDKIFVCGKCEWWGKKKGVVGRAREGERERVKWGRGCRVMKCISEGCDGLDALHVVVSWQCFVTVEEPKCALCSSTLTGTMFLHFDDDFRVRDSWQRVVEAQSSVFWYASP